MYSQLYEEHWDPIQHLTFMGLFEQGRKAPGSFEGGELLLVHEYMKSGRYFILGQPWGYRFSYISDQTGLPHCDSVQQEKVGSFQLQFEFGYFEDIFSV